jgi:hypothetical protein
VHPERTPQRRPRQTDPLFSSRGISAESAQLAPIKPGAAPAHPSARAGCAHLLAINPEPRIPSPRCSIAELRTPAPATPIGGRWGDLEHRLEAWEQLLPPIRRGDVRGSGDFSPEPSLRRNTTSRRGRGNRAVNPPVRVPLLGSLSSPLPVASSDSKVYVQRGGSVVVAMAPPHPCSPSLGDFCQPRNHVDGAAIITNQR